MAQTLQFCTFYLDKLLFGVELKGVQEVIRSLDLTRVPLAPGVVRDQLTLGATFALDDKNEISFDYLHAFGNTVNGLGSIPPAFGGGEVNVRLAENSIGVGFTHRL